MAFLIAMKKVGKLFLPPKVIQETHEANSLEARCLELINEQITSHIQEIVKDGFRPIQFSSYFNINTHCGEICNVIFQELQKNFPKLKRSQDLYICIFTADNIETPYEEDLLEYTCQAYLPKNRGVPRTSKFKLNSSDICESIQQSYLDRAYDYCGPSECKNLNGMLNSIKRKKKSLQHCFTIPIFMPNQSVASGFIRIEFYRGGVFIDAEEACSYYLNSISLIEQIACYITLKGRCFSIFQSEYTRMAKKAEKDEKVDLKVD